MLIICKFHFQTEKGIYLILIVIGSLDCNRTSDRWVPQRWECYNKVSSMTLALTPPQTPWATCKILWASWEWQSINSQKGLPSAGSFRMSPSHLPSSRSLVGILKPTLPPGSLRRAQVVEVRVSWGRNGQCNLLGRHLLIPSATSQDIGNMHQPGLQWHSQGGEDPLK